MIDFIQTLLIAVIPSAIAGLLSYLAAFNNSKTQIRTITEQNKADIQKLIEQHKVDIESLKEKHKMEIEIKEKDFLHQIDLVKLQHENELKKEEESMKNQLTMNAMGGLLGNMFSESSPFSKQLGDVLNKSLEEANNKNK